MSYASQRKHSRDYRARQRIIDEFAGDGLCAQAVQLLSSLESAEVLLSNYEIDEQCVIESLEVDEEYNYEEETSQEHSSEDENINDVLAAQFCVLTGTNQPSFREWLANWVVSSRISQKSTNLLLRKLCEVLNDCDGSDLPSDYRSLMKTPRNVEILNLSEGQFVYLGIANNLTFCFQNPDFCHKLSAYYSNYPSAEKTINLIVNVDGVPLFKSSSWCFWPILACGSTPVRTPPFPVALFCGTTKPCSLDEFFSSFLDEYDDLSHSGFSYKNDQYIVKIEAFSCDLPARQFLKNIKGHTGYYACERCTVKGSIESEHFGRPEQHGPGKKNMAFLDVNCASRVDQQFKDGAYSSSTANDGHQIGHTILMDHDIQCVSSFVIDVMHSVFLGATRRLLMFLISGPRRCRLSSQQLNQLSTKLTGLRKYWPSEFQRKPRSLKAVSRWKASEWFHWLLYSGPVVTKSFFGVDQWKHFLLFSIAIRLLLSNIYDVSKTELAGKFLERFILQCPKFYTRRFVTLNVHMLSHLSEDSLKFERSLLELSCFTFENYLQTLKRLVKSGSKPLEQVVRRLAEAAACGGYIPLHEHTFQIKPNNKDGWFLVRKSLLAPKDKIIIVNVIEQHHAESYICDGYPMTLAQDFFVYPCKSMDFGIFLLKKQSIAKTKRCLIHRRQIHNKCVYIDLDDERFLLIEYVNLQYVC